MLDCFIANYPEGKTYQSEKLLRSIIDTVPIPLAVNDDQQNIIYLNASFIKTFGYTLEDIPTLTQWWPRAYPDPTYRQWVSTTWQVNLEKAKRENKPFEPLEINIQSKDATVRTMLCSASPINDSHDSLTLVTLYDITEQKIFDRKINTITQYLNEAQKIAKLGSWHLNLVTTELEWSNEVYELFGIDKATHVPTYEGFLNAIHPEDRELVNEVYARSVESHTPYNYIHRLLMPDDSIKYVREQGETFYAPDGQPTASRGTVHDISEEVLLQKTLEAKNIELTNYTHQLKSSTEIAQNASKIKSDFLANMSHEIRTPLNGVIGLTELLLQTNLQPLQREYLNKSETASRALLNVLNNILDYSKIEAHKLILETRVFNLDDTLNSLHAMLSYKAEQKQLSLETHIDDSVPRMLIGDPLRLQQILSNLTVNALKFTQKGFVRIAITSTPQEDQAKLTFAISDSGIGMSKKEQTTLFQPFSQVDASFTRKYGGSGLGLMISKELVELMGGEVIVHSVSGEGSTFTFTILLECAPLDMNTVIEETHTSALPNHKPLHLLLVEDNDLNQLVASERLKQMGITCSIANNGLEAVEMVQKEVFDAVLMDLQMPIMDGLEATREIRKLPGYEKLPIIALSAAVLQDDLKMAIEAGMNDHIAKPIDKILLQDILAKWLGI